MAAEGILGLGTVNEKLDVSWFLLHGPYSCLFQFCLHFFSESVTKHEKCFIDWNHLPFHRWSETPFTHFPLRFLHNHHVFCENNIRIEFIPGYILTRSMGVEGGVRRAEGGGEEDGVAVKNRENVSLGVFLWVFLGTHLSCYIFQHLSNPRRN